MNLNHHYFNFKSLKNKIGFINSVIASIKYIFKKIINNINKEEDKENIFLHYKFLDTVPFGLIENKNCYDKKVLNWFIPDFGIGSGGHLNIFNFISHLEKRGFKCNLIIDGNSDFTSEEQALNTIRNQFYPINGPVFLGCDKVPPAWGTFATSWETAYTVRNFQGTIEKFYFVQDFEPYFYARGSEYCFAEETYRFGFKGITVGDWLANILKTKYGMSTYSCSYSYNKERYYPRERHDPEKKRLLFYSRPVTPRRGFELGLLAIKEVSKQIPNIDIILAGWDSSDYLIDFPHKDVGILHHDQLPALYSQCDVALVLSLTDLSLLPIELMACGCSVVSNGGENVEWFLNDDVAVLSALTPENLSSSIIKILNDDKSRLELRQRALDYVRCTDWNKEVDGVIKFFNEI